MAAAYLGWEGGEPDRSDVFQKSVLPIAGKTNLSLDTVVKGKLVQPATYTDAYCRNVRQNSKIFSQKVHGVNGQYFVL